MLKYILKPRQDFLEKIKDQGGNLNMITESETIYGLLKSRHESEEGIIAYMFRVPDQIIEFELENKLNDEIYHFLKDYWNIEEK